MPHIELCGYTSVYFSSLLWLESRFIHSGIKYSLWATTSQQLKKSTALGSIVMLATKIETEGCSYTKLH